MSWNKKFKLKKQQHNFVLKMTKNEGGFILAVINISIIAALTFSKTILYFVYSTLRALDTHTLRFQN